MGERRGKVGREKRKGWEREERERRERRGEREEEMERRERRGERGEEREAGIQLFCLLFHVIFVQSNIKSR